MQLIMYFMYSQLLFIDIPFNMLKSASTCRYNILVGIVLALTCIIFECTIMYDVNEF